VSQIFQFASNENKQDRYCQSVQRLTNSAVRQRNNSYLGIARHPISCALTSFAFSPISIIPRIRVIASSIHTAAIFFCDHLIDMLVNHNPAGQQTKTTRNAHLEKSGQTSDQTDVPRSSTLLFSHFCLQNSRDSHKLSAIQRAAQSPFESY
jgi:hypothetical protein